MRSIRRRDVRHKTAIPATTQSFDKLDACDKPLHSIYHQRPFGVMERTL